MDTPARPHTLDYAPRRTNFRRIFRWTALAMCVGAAAMGYWKYDAWIAPVVQRVTLLYWQRQCLNYTAPPTEVVFEEDPAQAAALLADRRYTAVMRPASGAAASVMAACRGQFEDTYAPGYDPPGATVFLHERHTPSGVSRLVAVDYFYGKHFDSFCFRSVNFAPATALEPLGAERDGVTGFPPWAWDEPKPAFMRVYAGQVDPDDPARFTIRYRIGRCYGVLDGYLEGDGPRPTLRVYPRQIATMSHKTAVAYYQRFAAYDPPPGQVACETDADAGAKLSAGPGEYGPRDVCGRSCVLFDPQEWRDSGFVPDRMGTVFLHELTASSGDRRLVHVACSLGKLDDHHAGPGHLWVTVFSPPTPTEKPENLPQAMPLNGPFDGRVDVPVVQKATRVFVGRADPKAPSQFTIEYEQDGKRPTLAGRLLPDATHVEFRLPNGQIASTDNP